MSEPPAKLATASSRHVAERLPKQVPAYGRLAAELRRSIVKGSAHPARLPTDLELCRVHGVSRQTVRRAYQELVSEGLVERTPGRGTFPSSGGPYVRSFGSIEDLMALSDDTVLEVLRPLAAAAGSARARSELGAEELMEVTIRRLHGEVPFVCTTVTLSAGIGRRLKRGVLARAGARRRTTVLQLLEPLLERPIVHCRQDVTVGLVPDDLAAWIGMNPGDPAIRIDRLYRDQAGAAVESTMSFFNPGRYTYRLDLRRSAVLA